MKHLRQRREITATARAALGALLALGAFAPLPGAAEERVEGPLREGAFTGYLDSAAQPPGPLTGWPGVLARVLSEDSATGRRAVRVSFPPGRTQPAAARQSVDLVLLEGRLALGEVELGPWDFAFLPPGWLPPEFSSTDGANALLFFDPPSPDPDRVARQRERGLRVTRYDAAGWEPAALARAAGATARLEVFHLKRDPDTTARTWYVRLSGDMTVPWEVHSMPEEGFVMSGGYVLAECLPGRTAIGEYRKGGYFWRPGGQPHSGPDSGPVGDVVWLQRTPVALDVVFYHDCEAGRPVAPVQSR